MGPVVAAGMGVGVWVDRSNYQSTIQCHANKECVWYRLGPKGHHRRGPVTVSQKHVPKARTAHCGDSAFTASPDGPQLQGRPRHRMAPYATWAMPSDRHTSHGMVLSGHILSVAWLAAAAAGTWEALSQQQRRNGALYHRQTHGIQGRCWALEIGLGLGSRPHGPPAGL